MPSGGRVALELLTILGQIVVQALVGHLVLLLLLHLDCATRELPLAAAVPLLHARLRPLHHITAFLHPLLTEGGVPAFVLEFLPAASVVARAVPGFAQPAQVPLALIHL